MTDERFASDRYVVEQLIRPMVNLYRISADGRPVAFVRQKRFALKEEIRFFGDESEREELFSMKARQVLDVRSRVAVTSAGGEPIALLEKDFRASLLRSTWRVLAPDESELAVAREQNVVVALLRRVQDTIPLPYHFELRSGDRTLGQIRRAFSIRDRYELDLSGDAERTLDRRAAVALTIALDALQSR